jgi:hypothetical protein
MVLALSTVSSLRECGQILLPSGSAIHPIQDTRVSTGLIRILTRCWRQISTAARTSSTASATHVGSSPNSGWRLFPVPLRQSVSGSVANSLQKMIPLPPVLKAKKLLVECVDRRMFLVLCVTKSSAEQETAALGDEILFFRRVP